MKERPILFSGAMVRALLNGTKTQTRRALKGVPPMPEADCHPNHQWKHVVPYLDSYCNGPIDVRNPKRMSENWCWWQVDDRQCLPTFKVPYVPGDLLWVRETWHPYGDDGKESLSLATSTCTGPEHILFRASASEAECAIHRWRPAIFMPKWASRISLLVKNIRVERLQDITCADAIAEGIRPSANSQTIDCDTPDPRQDFARLWEGINGSGSWDANPWVAVIEFERMKEERKEA